jgi:hypothetical protein
MALYEVAAQPGALYQIPARQLPRRAAATCAGGAAGPQAAHNTNVKLARSFEAAPG